MGTELATLEEIHDAEIIDAPAVQQSASLLVRPVAPSAAIIANMREYEAVKRAILTDADYQQTRDGRFMKKSGYVKLSTAFGFSAEKVSERLDQDSDGHLIGAAITVRATAPNGRYAEGDGYCSIDEPRFTHQYDNKQKGIKTGDPILSARQKLRHDLPATAFTRAYNRACSFLFPGGGEVSWEEVDAGGEYHSLRSSKDEPEQKPEQGGRPAQPTQPPSNGNGAEFDALTDMAEKIAANHGTVAKAIFGLAYGELWITGKLAGQLAALTPEERARLHGWLENRLKEANGSVPTDVAESDGKKSTVTQHATIRKMAADLGKAIPDDDTFEAMPYAEAAALIIQYGKEKKERE